MHAHLGPFILLAFCNLSGDNGRVEASNADFFFVRKGLRSVLTKLGECFLSPVQGSSVTCSFFVRKVMVFKSVLLSLKEKA